MNKADEINAYIFRLRKEYFRYNNKHPKYLYVGVDIVNELMIHRGYYRDESGQEEFKGMRIMVVLGDDNHLNVG